MHPRRSPYIKPHRFFDLPMACATKIGMTHATTIRMAISSCSSRDETKPRCGCFQSSSQRPGRRPNAASSEPPPSHHRSRKPGIPDTTDPRNQGDLAWLRGSFCARQESNTPANRGFIRRGRHRGRHRASARVSKRLPSSYDRRRMDTASVVTSGVLAAATVEAVVYAARADARAKAADDSRRGG
jgi:hypothetical protein